MFYFCSDPVGNYLHAMQMKNCAGLKFGEFHIRAVL